MTRRGEETMIVRRMDCVVRLGPLVFVPIGFMCEKLMRGVSGNLDGRCERTESIGAVTLMFPKEGHGLLMVLGVLIFRVI